MRSTTANSFVMAILGLTTPILANVFALTALESLEKSEVSSKCYAAYSAPIPGCSTSIDTCSDTCISSLDKATTSIRAECEDAFVGMDSLLRRAVDGGLLSIICPDAMLDIVDSTPKATDVALSTTIKNPPVPIQAFKAITTAGSVDERLDIVIDTRSLSFPTTATKTSSLLLDLGPTPTAGISGSLARLADAEETSGAEVENGDDDSAAAGLASVSWGVLSVALVAGVLIMA